MYNYAERNYPDNRGTIVCHGEQAELVEAFDFITEVESFTQKETFHMLTSDDVELFESEWVEFNPFLCEYHTISYYDMVELGRGFRAFPSDLVNKIISYRGDLFRMVQTGRSHLIQYKLIPTQFAQDREEACFLPFWA